MPREGRQNGSLSYNSGMARPLQPNLEGSQRPSIDAYRTGYRWDTSARAHVQMNLRFRSAQVQPNIFSSTSVRFRSFIARKVSY